jgi:hypothetical protein
METTRNLLRSWLLAAVFLPFVVQAQFAFTTNNDTITITAYMGPGGDVVVPATTNGYPVVSIGPNAFWPQANATNVTIPYGITNIGNSAFASCDGLASLTFPDSVLSLGNNMCQSCLGLTNVVIGNGVTSIGSGAFQNCTNLSAVTFGTNVATIYASAFFGCSSLTSVALPKSLVGGVSSAFSPCTGLTNISIDPANTYMLSSNGVLFSKDMGYLMQFPEGQGGAYTVPDAVTNIAYTAFNQCSALTSVTLSKNVLIMNDTYATAFQACRALTNITVASANPNYSTLNGVLFNKSQTVLLQYPGGKTGTYTVPNTVTNLGTNCFSGSVGITGVVIPQNTAVIRYGAFSTCTNLSSVILGSGVSVIELQAFADCLSLTNLVIPASVTNLQSGAFEACPNLANIFFSSNAPTAGSLIFQGDANLTVCHLPGMTGWGSTYGGVDAVPWNPSILTTNTGFGAQSNKFGFTITGATGIPFVVTVCTNLTNPLWQPVQTNWLTSGKFYFSDSQFVSNPGCYYRLRSP